VELAAQRVTDAELEPPQTSVVWVWDMVLDRADGLSSQSTSLSMAAELLEGRVNAAPSNGVH
jgi:hypothetical protein